MGTDIEIKTALHGIIDRASPEQNRMLFWLAKELANETSVTEGPPMSQKELVDRVMAAKARIEASGGISQDELEAEIQSW